MVNHENISKSDYCTISQEGVTRMRNDDETEFVTLDRWEQEYNYFKKIIKVGTGVDQGNYQNGCRFVRMDQRIWVEGWIKKIVMVGKGVDLWV